MNADEAYELHTDVVRALSDPNSDARSAFNAYVEHTESRLQGMHVLMEPHHMRAMNEAGQEDARVVIVMDVEQDSSQEARPDWFAEDPSVDPEAAPQETPDAAAVPWDQYVNMSLTALAAGSTFYVTADMCAVLTQAAASLDETDVMPFHPDHSSGFVVLATPLRLPYGDGTYQTVHAFGWSHYLDVRTVFGSSGKAGTVFQFADRVKAPEDKGVRKARPAFTSKTAWLKSPRLVMTMADDFVVGAPVGPVVESIAPREQLARRQAAMFAEAVSTSVDTSQPDEPVVGRFQPYLAAFLLLLTQQVTAPVTREVGAGPQKRATKAGRSSHRVTVVDLRPRSTDHPDDSHGDGTGERRHYSARHLVGGHWKWQAYGPERRLRRRIFVEGYVRGPEDKPLIVKPRVYRL